MQGQRGINWGSVMSGLISCASFAGLGVSFDGECIEQRLLPQIAKNFVDNMDTIAISGTNPMPRNRSWAKANAGALVLIIIMVILCAMLIAAIVICLSCGDGAAGDDESKGREEDDEMSTQTNPLTATEIENNNGLSRYSSRYSVTDSQKTSPDGGDSETAAAAMPRPA